MASLTERLDMLMAAALPRDQGTQRLAFATLIELAEADRVGLERELVRRMKITPVAPPTAARDVGAYP